MRPEQVELTELTKHKHLTDKPKALTHTGLHEERREDKSYKLTDREEETVTDNQRVTN